MRQGIQQKFESIGLSRRSSRTLGRIAGAALIARLLLPGPAVRGDVSTLLDRDAVLASAREVTADRYPNADDVLVAEHIRIEYQADGTSTTRDDEYVKVLTEKGRRDASSRSIPFTLPYDTAEVLLAEVIKPDGRTVTLDLSRQSRVMVDRSQMSDNIFNPNDKILQLTLTDLEVGDLYHLVSRRDTVKARVPDTWSDYTIFEYTSPLKRLVYEISGPEDRPLRHVALKDEVAGTVVSRAWVSDGRCHYRWEVNDVPRMYEEPNMPPLHTVVQRLLVSTIPDWESISRWYWTLSEPHLKAVTPDMEARTQELVKGLEDRQARIEALFRFVSQQVRYMGITTEKEAPGYEPHDVGVTFANRYGVCRDKAALLTAMLRLAGLPAYPVLIHQGEKKDEAVPQPYFNHAIVGVDDGAGGYVLMDPTNEHTTRLLPAYLCDKSYLVARPEGDRLRTSAIDPAERNLLRIDGSGRVDETGTLHMRNRLVFEGVNDSLYRGHFARLKTEERQRFFEGVLKRRVAGARVTHFDVQPGDLQDTSVPLTVSMDFTAPDFLIRGADCTMIAPPWLGTALGFVNFVLGQTGLETRKYPLNTEVACGVEESFDLDLSGRVGPALILPDFTPIATNQVVFSRQLSLNGGHLSGQGTFALKAVEYSPAEYRELKRILKDIEYDLRKKPLFAPAPGPRADNDVITRSRETRVTLADAHQGTVTTSVTLEVLNYAGKKAYAELMIPFNPVWQNVVVRRAVVITREGTIHRVSPQEINLMDADWVGQAPRYPAARTLVVSLPGVDVGSLIDYEIEQSFHDQPFFSMVHSFADFNRLESSVLRVSVPDAMPLKVRDMTGGDVAFCEESRDGRRTLTWNAGSREATAREDAMPPWWSFNPTVFLSAGNWTSYAAEVSASLEAAAAGQTAAEARGRELVEQVGDAGARVKAIRDYVAVAIRPGGPGLAELPLTAVSPADMTLREGYGHSADRAVLLVAMLRAAGLTAEFVLAAPGGSRVAFLRQPWLDCPQRDQPNDVLVRVRYDDQTIYLNDSDQYARLGTTINEGRPGIDMDGKPIVIDLPPDLRTRTVGRYVVDMEADGDAVITSRDEFYGAAFGAFHRFFAELTPEERRRHYEEMAADIAQAAVAQGELKTDTGVYPGIKEFRVRVDHFGVRTGRYLHLTLPGSAAGVLDFRADRRVNPLYFDGDTDRVVEYEVWLPEGMDNVHLAPEALQWTGPDHLGTWRCEVERETINGRTVLRLREVMTWKAAVIDAAHYSDLLDISRRLRHPSRRTILVSATGKPDARFTSGADPATSDRP